MKKSQDISNFDKLMEKLERLRREPIGVINLNATIPGHEESDANCLCKHPLVSVMMTTYNHESYIRDAIEGVVSQQCDFEFELIIGEDCSTDRTRAICLEYQKQYPTIIRVLWADKNVGARRNSSRNYQHARGRYLAWCEGDDYWTSDTKLKEQAEVLETCEDVSIVYTDFDILKADKLTVEKNVLACSGILDHWHAYTQTDFLTEMNFGLIFFATASIMIRSSVYAEYLAKEPVASQCLSLGDMGLRVFAAKVGAPKCLAESMVVYRLNETGITQSRTWRRNMLLLDIIYMRLALLKGCVSDSELFDVLQWYLINWTPEYVNNRFPWGFRFCWFRVLLFCLFNNLMSLSSLSKLLKHIMILPLPLWLLTTVQRSNQIVKEVVASVALWCNPTRGSLSNDSE
jgi:glycosyltransferase involved in cell wall biosynthesis